MIVLIVNWRFISKVKTSFMSIFLFLLLWPHFIIKVNVLLNILSIVFMNWAFFPCRTIFTGLKSFYHICDVEFLETTFKLFMSNSVFNRFFIDILINLSNILLIFLYYITNFHLHFIIFILSYSDFFFRYF